MQTAIASALWSSQRPPLCHSYHAVLVTVGRATVGDAATGARVGFALGWGVSRHGGPEFLGAWPGALQPASAACVAADLQVRGVQRLGLLVNGGSEDLGAAVLRAFPGATVALPFHPVAQLALSVVSPCHGAAVSAGLGQLRRAQSLAHAHAVLDALAAGAWRDLPVVPMCRAVIPHWQAVYDLPQRARQQVARSEDAVWLLQQGLGRALGRQAPFETAAAAVAFAEAWLDQAQQREQRRRLALAHRAAVAAARAGG